MSVGIILDQTATLRVKLKKEKRKKNKAEKENISEQAW